MYQSHRGDRRIRFVPDDNAVAFSNTDIGTDENTDTRGNSVSDLYISTNVSYVDTSSGSSMDSSIVVTSGSSDDSTSGYLFEDGDSTNNSCSEDSTSGSSEKSTSDDESFSIIDDDTAVSIDLSDTTDSSISSNEGCIDDNIIDNKNTEKNNYYDMPKPINRCRWFKRTVLYPIERGRDKSTITQERSKMQYSFLNHNNTDVDCCYQCSQFPCICDNICDFRIFSERQGNWYPTSNSSYYNASRGIMTVTPGECNLRNNRIFATNYIGDSKLYDVSPVATAATVTFVDDTQFGRGFRSNDDISHIVHPDDVLCDDDEMTIPTARPTTTRSYRVPLDVYKSQDNVKKRQPPLLSNKATSCWPSDIKRKKNRKVEATSLKTKAQVITTLRRGGTQNCGKSARAGEQRNAKKRSRVKVNINSTTITADNTSTAADVSMKQQKQKLAAKEKLKEKQLESSGKGKNEHRILVNNKKSKCTKGGTISFDNGTNFSTNISTGTISNNDGSCGSSSNGGDRVCSDDSDIYCKNILHFTVEDVVKLYGCSREFAVTWHKVIQDNAFHLKLLLTRDQFIRCSAFYSFANDHVAREACSIDSTDDWLLLVRSLFRRTSAFLLMAGNNGRVDTCLSPSSSSLSSLSTSLSRTLVNGETTNLYRMLLTFRVFALFVTRTDFSRLSRKERKWCMLKLHPDKSISLITEYGKHEEISEKKGRTKNSGDCCDTTDKSTSSSSSSNSVDNGGSVVGSDGVTAVTLSVNDSFENNNGGNSCSMERGTLTINEEQRVANVLFTKIHRWCTEQ